MNERLKKSIERLESYIDFEKLKSGEVSKSTVFDLDRFKQILDERGNPQNKYPSVLIAGSKGKGSTSAFLESILRQAGHKTGLYTSPHLVAINERIRINGICIDDERFAIKLEELLNIAEKKGSEKNYRTVFEILTASAFELFAEEDIDIAVVEVGLGGRLDATNALEPIATVITRIGLDHTDVLGDNLRDIAFEKAGILRKNVPLVIGNQDEIAKRAILEKAHSIGSRPVKAFGEDFHANACCVNEEGFSFDYSENSFSISLLSSLIGEFQIENCANAVSTALELKKLGFNIEDEDIKKGVLRTKWFGRMQIFPLKNATIIIDGAHSPMSMRALIDSVRAIWGKRIPVFVFAANRDKDIESMFLEIIPFVETLIITRFDWPRSATIQELDSIIEKIFEENPDLKKINIKREQNPSLALERAKKISSGGIIVCAGSLYFTGELLKAMGFQPCEKFLSL